MLAEIDSSRHLALRLHALHASDRDWILSRLDSEARARLEPMLQELDSLGFRIDQGIVDSIAGLAGDSEAESAASAGQPEVEILDRAPPQWIAKQLKGEPQALVDCLAAIHPWTWLATLEASDKPPTRSGEPHLGPMPRVRQALLAEMVRRLQADRPGNDEAAPVANKQYRMSEPAPANAARRAWRWLPWMR